MFYSYGYVDRVLWDDRKEDMMLDVLRAKFSENTSLRQLLVDTGDALLVNATSHPVWGSGLDAPTLAKTPISSWPGTNFMGDQMMRLRVDLQIQAEYKADWDVDAISREQHHSGPLALTPLGQPPHGNSLSRKNTDREGLVNNKNMFWQILSGCCGKGQSSDDSFILQHQKKVSTHRNARSLDGEEGFSETSE